MDPGLRPAECLAATEVNVTAIVGTDAPDRLWHGPDRTRVVVAAAIPALIAIGVCLYQLHLPNVLYGAHDYGEGVYLGAAIGMVHGVVPYRDFVFLHPPGILVLMSPIASLGSRFGTYTSLAITRDVTAIVTALNAVLVTLVLRHRGFGASLIAGIALACFPLAPAADSTLLLEPYLVFFCLLGMLLMSHAGALASPRRVMVAGLTFGFAGSIKIWAFLIVTAAVLVCLTTSRRAVLPLLAGSAVGVGVPSLPFFLMAPHAFLHDVLSVQAERVVGGADASSIGARLSSLTGFAAIGVPNAVAVIVVAAFAVLVATVFVMARRSMASGDWMILTSAVFAVGAMLSSSSFYPHYAYFPAVFLAMLVGVSAGATAQLLRDSSVLASRLLRPTSVLIACATTVAVLVPQQASYARSRLSSAIDSLPLNLFVPPGACVLADMPSIPLAADLYTSTRPGCPTVVDPFGTWLAHGPPHLPPYPGPYPATFLNQWARWLGESDYLVTVEKYSILIPWTPALRAWFARDFTPTLARDGIFLYRHSRHTPPPVLATSPA